MALPSGKKALVILVDAARRDATEPLFAASRVQALAGAARPAMVAPSCWTVPSVASLLTGVYPWEHGLHWPLNHPSHPRPTLASFIEAAGGRMSLVSANEMYSPPVLDLKPGVAHFPLQRTPRLATGLRRVLGLLDYGGRLVEETVAGLLADDPPDALVVHLNEAHHPYLPPVDGPLARGGMAYSMGHVRYYLTSGAQVWEAAARADEEAWRQARARYEACLAYDVAIVERVIELYEQAGLLEDTFVVVTADHGEHLGEHGLADHQASLYEELVRVPCAVIGPGLPAGDASQAQFQHTDIAGTICKHLGVPMDGYVPSNVPLDILDVANWERGHEHAFMEWTPWGDDKFASLCKRNPGYDFSALRRDLVGLRTPEWKYIVGSDGSRALYDLARDSGESTDVSGEQAEVARDLEARLAAWCGAVGRPVPGEDPLANDSDGAYSEADQEEIQKRLSDLGYM